MLMHGWNRELDYPAQNGMILLNSKEILPLYELFMDEVSTIPASDTVTSMKPSIMFLAFVIMENFEITGSSKE